MFEILRKSLTIFCCDFRFRAVQKCDNLVDLGKCCKMSIYLQNFMPIQPRTSLLKFGHLAAKSGKSTVLYLSTKVDAHVALHLFEECLTGCLQGKTRVLVTHQQVYFPKADHIILLDKGSVAHEGSYEELLQRGVVQG